MAVIRPSTFIALSSSSQGSTIPTVYRPIGRHAKAPSRSPKRCTTPGMEYAYTGSRHARSCISSHPCINTLSSRDGAEGARRGDPGANGAGLCRILDMNFREFLFYDVG